MNNLQGSLFEWNKTEQDIPSKTIAELFYNRAKISSSQCAAIHNNSCLSYNELNEASNRLAHFLIDHQRTFSQRTSSNFMVGISMDRSFDMLISLLAIHKAGGAFIPIDPGYPTERIDFIIQDTKINILLTHQNIIDEKLKNLKKDTCNIIALDTDCIKRDLAKFPAFNAVVQYNTTDLAYVIYTSGSTGNPKGVLIEHRSLVNYTEWAKDYLTIKESERVDCSSSLSFDFTITTTIVPLLYGATVVLCDENTKNDPAKYEKHLNDNKINIIKLVPTYFNLICDLNQKENYFQNLRAIILGGENVCPLHVKKWLDNNQSHTIFNEYGPTETTVGVTLSIYRYGETFEDISIGKPGFNIKAYVLDENLKQTPIGIQGDLYISGICVAQGYLNRDDLTNERFIRNTDTPVLQNYERLYKTGDLAAWQTDRSLKCSGRSDDQVKINGHRIELGEIEKALNQCPGVSQSVVVKKENSNFQYLVAYYIPLYQSGLTITEITLKERLSQMIPSYMLPQHFIEVKHFELSINGKIDKKKLPLPTLSEKKIHKVNTFATTEEIEKILSSIWMSLLTIEEVDSDINFFDLGANSLLVTQFHTELIDRGYTLELLDIFQYPTIRSLAQKLKPSNENIHSTSQNKNINKRTIINRVRTR